MKVTLRILILLLLTQPALAQEPVITWGPAIDRELREVQNLHIVGTSAGDFYTVHKADGQATLERYSAGNQRLWATALLPKTAKGQPADFYDVLLLDGKLHLLSTHQATGVTTVYAQEITSSGNYRPAIRTLTSAQTNGSLSISVSKDLNDVLVVLTDRFRQNIAASLYNASLTPRWSQTFKIQGTFAQAAVLNDGTSFVLAENDPSAPHTAAYNLYRLDARNGRSEETAIGHQRYALTQAMMAPGSTDLLLAGYFTPATASIAQQPEPAGTFYYRFSSDRTKRTMTAYTPFDAQFIRNFKKDRSDFDRSRRLRSLQLSDVEPTISGGAYILGEVVYQETTNGARSYNYDDIVVARMEPDGSVAYITSVAKLQEGPYANKLLYSYLVARRDEELYLFYQNFGDSVSKEVGQTAVITRILPEGGQETERIQSRGAGRQVHIRPAVAYPVSATEFILLGSGPGFYRFGRLKF